MDGGSVIGCFSLVLQN